MPEFTITSHNPEGLVQQLRAIQQTGCGALTKECWAIANEIEAQLPKAPVEEPSGDVVVFFSLSHPRMGVGWAADDGQWEDGTGHSLSWEQLVGDGTAKDVMLYRRVPYPEPSSSPAEEPS